MMRFTSYRRGWLDAASGRDADPLSGASQLDYKDGWKHGFDAREAALLKAMNRFHVTSDQIKLSK